MTLARLIEAVEAGCDDSEKWRPALGDHAFDGMTAFHGSLDAAKRLHDALLPGWIWGVTSRDDELGIPAAFVANPDDPEQGFEAHCADPARAMLLADLRAYAAILRAMEGRDG